MDHPKISIITPVYNGERFIEGCIKNVIEQNCPDIEHIIVDGGSTDKTVEIIKVYAAEYNHIVWISEKDRGQSDAMNKGIGLARGSIMGILNVDDFYEPNVLTRVLGIFKTLDEPSLVVGNCNILDDNDKIVFVNKPVKLAFTDLLEGPYINPFPANSSSYFYHISLHQKIGPYKIDECYMMDVDFLLRAVQSATTHYFDEVWGNMRWYEGTKTHYLLVSGKLDEHVESVLVRYRKGLSLIKKLKVYSVIKYHKVKNSLRIKNIKYILPFGIIIAKRKIMDIIAENKTKKKIEFLLKNKKPINLELGAIEKRMEGWLTVDRAEGADIRLDLRFPLPFPLNCIDQIYSSHLLEHFPHAYLIKLLFECKRILKPGGLFKVSVPNARIYLEAYFHPEGFDVKRHCVSKVAFNYYSEIDFVNYIAYMYEQHCHMFDEKSLLIILNRVGFKNVKLREFDPKLDLEVRKHESIYAVGEK